MGIKAKKSLGQHFLADAATASRIVQFISPGAGERMVEIGPGTGVLTRLVQPQAERLFAVEIDSRCAGLLRREFGPCDNFTLIEADILALDLDKAIPVARYRVFGNIPYSITSPILFKVFESRDRVIDLTLMVQKEVGERIVASPGNRTFGITSVFSQLYADVKLLLRIPFSAFRPRPEVDSVLVRWDFASDRSQRVLDEAHFRRLVRRAFGQRRKMLRNSLGNEIPVEYETQRPEQLSVSQWIELANATTAKPQHGSPRPPGNR